MAFSLVFIACSDGGTTDTGDTGDTGTPPPAEGFSTIAAFKTWLDAQPANTAAKAYSVKVNIADLGGQYNTAGSLGNALFTNRSPAKYVNLDLSGSTLTSIGQYAFSSCSSLTGVILPNSVTSIGDYAFMYCTSLTSVTIPNSVTSIGERAFSMCTNLTGVTIPNSVTSIGEYAFSGSSLTSITIPNSVTSIGYTAFYACRSLTGVTIGSGVTSIGDSAFGKCSSLTAINVDPANSAYTSENGVLYNKAKTTLIRYPQGKTGAFSIPASVTSIGQYAFESCTSLTSVTIPTSVTSIGGAAFSDCTSLTSVTIPNSVTSIGYTAFQGCTSLNSVTIGSGVTFIGQYAFASCTSLTIVIFQGTITSTYLDNNAFGYGDNSIGDLRAKYLAGGVGTYTRSGSGSTAVWTKS